MNTKQCRHCLKTLPLELFIKRKSTNDGRENICTSCMNKQNTKYYYKNHEHTLSVKRRYGQNNREKRRLASRKYYQENKQEIKKRAQKRYKANPEKYRARGIAVYAIKNGQLIIQDCSECEAPKEKTKIDAHHPDYTKPLEVIWLCRSCHLLLHAKMRRANP